MRDTRKVDLEKQVEAVNALIKKAEDELSENGEDESKVEQGGGVDVPGIIDEEAEYIDEDRHTTVTIEAVDVTRDGLRKVVDEDVESVGEENSHATEDVEMKDGKAAADGTGKRAWTKERPGGPKKKKPKFRYESKGDRKITRYKERSGNKAKAKARSSEAETRAGGGKAQAMARKNKRKK
jgi:ribosomal RNA-processing protein 17